MKIPEIKINKITEKSIIVDKNIYNIKKCGKK